MRRCPGQAKELEMSPPHNRLRCDSMQPMSRLRLTAVIAASLLGGGLALATPVAAGPASPVAPPTWSASTPTVTGAPITSLVGVTCVTAADCWAVGSRFRSSSSNSGPALIEHYADGLWSTVTAAPAKAGTLDQLLGVGCLSADNCWAAGMRSGAHPGNLLEHYGAGGHWTAVGTPAPQGQLSALSCDGSDGQCWAVGAALNGTRAITFHLVEGSWHSVAAAPLTASFVQVSGVACATADDCLLVGFATPKHGAGVALAERWNGRIWSRVTVPGQLSAGGALQGVTCLPGHAPTTCWAVGQTAAKGSGLGPIRPLVERWNGSAFKLIASPLGSAGDYPEPAAVACASRAACQAVGSRGSGEDESRVLTEGWDGSAWSQELSPSPLYGIQTLTGVACPSAVDCWAVGEGLNKTGTGSLMLIEHYAAPVRFPEVAARRS